MFTIITSTNKMPISIDNSTSNSSRQMVPNFRKTEANMRDRMDFLKGTSGNFSSPTNFYNENNGAAETNDSRQRFQSFLTNGASKILPSVESAAISKIGERLTPEKATLGTWPTPL